jgi:hypothetical protein
MSDIQDTWFIVVDQARSVIGEMSVECVKMSPSDTVKTFLAAALPLVPNILRNRDQKNLKVYHDFNSGEHIPEESRIWGMGVAGPAPLGIVAGKPRARRSSAGKRTEYRMIGGPIVTRNHIDSIAAYLYIPNVFPCPAGRPTFGALIASIKNKTWTPRTASERMFLYDTDGNLTIVLKRLHDETSKKIHDATIPRTPDGKPYIILSPDDRDENTCTHIRTVACAIGLVENPSDLIIKYANDLSESE